MSTAKVKADVIDVDAYVVETEWVWDYLEKRSGGQVGGKPVRKKFLLFVLTTLFLATVSPTQSQQAGKVPRIGFLDPSSASGSAVLLDAFRQELSKLGWIEGKNVTIEYRFAEGENDRLPELAAKLVRLKVDLIVTTAGPPALAAKGATSTIPIVMTTLRTPWVQVWLLVWRGREVMSPVCQVYRPS